MASMKMPSKQTPRKDLTCLSLVLHIVLCQLTFLKAEKVHNQAFIQTDNVLRYVVDGKPLQGSSGQAARNVQNGANSIVRFYPPILDFEDQPVGMPKVEQVTVANTGSDKPIQLLSISGTTLHFHCSFFQDKTVPPRSNTTFDVVFLARQVGNAENTLYIHTSHGTFRYQVFGVGTSNPYRLQPLVGAKLPVNSTFSPLIQMYNPHSTAIQVVEMYSSGGDLHLELPSGEREAHRKDWEIPPYETKAVMRASFVGRKEDNHVSFIRIKTNETRDDREVLVLPVEVEVTAAPGIYSQIEKLDFGIVRTLDRPHTLRLSLINSSQKPVHITSITVSPANEAVSVEFRPIKLLPGVLRRTQVATVTYTADKALHPRQWSGQIVITTRDDEYRLTLPYQATVLHGSLVYERNNTVFYSGKQEKQTRQLPLTNTFGFTLVIYNYSLPDNVKQYFSVSNLSPPVLLKPQETLRDLLIHFQPNSSELHASFDLVLATNASAFTIPIFVYNGRLKVVHHRPEILKGNLDFGTMGIEEQRSMTFTLRNDNPVDIVISEYSCKMDKTSIELLGVEKGNGTTLTRIHNVSDRHAKPLVLKPYHYAVFSVNLVAPNWEATFVTDVLIQTQFEHLYIPMTLRTAKGSLRAKPEKIVFDNVYPGKVSYKVLRIHSSFTNLTEVRDVTFQPKDSRFYYHAPRQSPVVLKPAQDTVIGKVYFDARKECGDDCYVGLSTQTPAGHQWLLGLGLDKEVTDTDQYLYNRFKQKWQILGARDQSTINTTIQLDTNQVWGFLFPAHAHLTWPALINRAKLKFPLTQIGNTSVMSFQVENGGDVPVLVQALTLSAYPNAATMANQLSSNQLPAEMDVLDDYQEDTFSLVDLHRTNTSAHTAILNQHKTIESQLGVRPHGHTVAALLQPGTQMTFNVGFTPRDEKGQATVILLRNNLTIIDSVMVEGRGATGDMRFSNRPPGSAAPLLFDMTERHLRDCDRKKSSKVAPNFTVRKFFTIKNSGELPFYIHGFSIHDQACEGFGFRVLNCSGFLLEPNASERIHIIFTPDFTMSRIQRTLTVYTTLGPPVNFTLQATLPPYMLTKCAAALPRPAWEPLLYYSAVSSMVFLLLCIGAAAYFEADRIYTADIIQRRYKTTNDTVSSTPDKSKFFDLRKIGATDPIDKSKIKPKPEMNGNHDTSRKVLGGTMQNQNPSVHKGKNEVRKEKVVNGGVRTVGQGKRRKDDGKKRKNEDRDEGEEYALEEEAPTLDSTVVKEDKAKLKRRNPKSTINNNSIPASTTTPTQQTTPLQQSAPSSTHSTPPSRGKNDVTEAKRRKNHHEFDNDRDEVSSTSTESSLESDERLITRDSTPDLHLNILKATEHAAKNAKNKNKKKKVADLPELPTKSDSCDEDFVMSTKGKKKSKAEKKLSGGGAKQSSFEAPQSPKLPDSPGALKDLRLIEPPSPHSIASEAANRMKKALKNNGKINKKPDGALSGEEFETPRPEASWHVVEETESSASCDSPPPLWDLPGPIPSDGDLSEFALQSEQFALRQTRPGPPTPEPLSSSSSRSGSYSSIVSNSASDSAKKNGSLTPGAPATRDSPRSYTAPELKFPGPVGSRTLAKPRSHTTAATINSRPWTMSPTTPEGVLGLNPIQEMSQYQAAMLHGARQPTMDQFRMMPHDLQTKILTENQVMRDMLAMSQAGMVPFTAPQEPTMMQRLQAERRKRFMEYQERIMKGEDWPGFGPTVAPPSESLWDTPPYQPPTAPNEWSPEMDCAWEPRPPVAGSSPPSWGTLSSIWANNPGFGGASGAEQPASFMDLAPGGGQDSGQEALPAFDPFNTLGHIWTPGSGATSGWSRNQTPNSNQDAGHE